MAELERGNRLHFSGLLILQDMTSKYDPTVVTEHTRTDIVQKISCTTVAVIELAGMCALSMSALTETSQDVGQIGYNTDWKDVPVSCNMENLSDVDLLFHVELPTSISVADGKAHGRCIPPKSSEEIKLFLHCSKESLGDFSSDVIFVNDNNLNDSNSFTIHGSVSDCLLNLSHGLKLDGPLVLPILLLSSSSESPPSERCFSFENLHSQEMDIHLSILVVPNIESYIRLEILSSSSGDPIHDVHIRSDDEQSVRVRISWVDGAQLPSKFLRTEVELGKLVISSNLFTHDESLEIRGSFAKGSPFSLSHTRVRLRTQKVDISESIISEAAETGPQSTVQSGILTEDYFHIINKSGKVLSCSLQLDPPFDGLTISPILLDISPGQKGRVNVALGPPITEWKALTEKKSTRLIVSEVNSLTTPQTLMIDIVPAAVRHLDGLGSAVHSISGSTQNSPELKRRVLQHISITKPPVLKIRGCIPVLGSINRYGINLGQVDYRSEDGFVEWDFTVENTTDSVVEYRIQALDDCLARRQSEDDESSDRFLSLSRENGILEGLQDAHSVTLRLSTMRVGHYSTYLIMRNIQNPSDVHTMRVEMEVVGQFDENVHFQVHVDGKQSIKRIRSSGDAYYDVPKETPILDIGEVYFSHVYTDLSFLLVNSSNVTLDFNITSTLDPTLPSQLYFSLSNASLQLCNTITVEGGGKVRIYLHFYPLMGEPGTLESTDGLEVNSEDSSPPVENLKCMININCRLIKDFRQSIQFKAVCRKPQMLLSTNEVAFSIRQTALPGHMTISPADLSRHSLSASLNPQASFSESVILSSSLNYSRVSDDSPRRRGTGAGRSVLARRKRFLSAEFSSCGLRSSPLAVKITLNNLYSADLEYTIRNSSLFSLVEVIDTYASVTPDLEGSAMSSTTSNIRPGVQHAILVTPNAAMISQNKQLFLREKCLEEHFTIYNRDQLTEICVVNVRFVMEDLTNVFTSSAPRDAYPFSKLEDLIVKFLQDFQCFFNPVSQWLLKQEGSDSDEKSDDLESPREQPYLAG
eukprot:495315_1